MFTVYVSHARSALLSPTSEVKRRFAATATHTLPPVLSPTKPVPVELPSEAAALKDHIRQACPAKLYAFSLAHMRKLAVPPVEIPKTYRSPRARSMVVGGRDVPFTRAMWDRSKRRLALAKAKRGLHAIHEGVVYD